mmetsp:Transcript_3548/g.7188  ORF Transcript_3548/g.7188 Transcript_3548/m.7188 type:complete len:261 (-) Transcript_3548:829-1611(-)
MVMMVTPGSFGSIVKFQAMLKLDPTVVTSVHVWKFICSPLIVMTHFNGIMDTFAASAAACCTTADASPSSSSSSSCFASKSLQSLAAWSSNAFSHSPLFESLGLPACKDQISVGEFSLPRSTCVTLESSSVRESPDSASQTDELLSSAHIFPSSSDHESSFDESPPYQSLVLSSQESYPSLEENKPDLFWDFCPFLLLLDVFSSAKSRRSVGGGGGGRPISSRTCSSRIGSRLFSHSRRRARRSSSAGKGNSSPRKTSRW